MHHAAHHADILLALPFVAALVLYWVAVATSRARRPWPWWRTVLWTTGIAGCLASVVGPVAELADRSFAVHMVSHVVLAMAAPLLLVLSAPLTLALRALPVHKARLLVRVLASRPVACVTSPLTAVGLSLGGLWLLYTTSLYAWMHESQLVHVLVHVHVLVWGYLFTAAVVGVDPDPRRLGFGQRAAVLTLFIAGHAVLAKFLYAHPPVHVPPGDAERGAMLMYYGGDVVDVAILVLLGHRWYVTGRTRVPAPTTGLLHRDLTLAATRTGAGRRHRRGAIR